VRRTGDVRPPRLVATRRSLRLVRSAAQRWFVLSLIAEVAAAVALAAVLVFGRRLVEALTVEGGVESLGDVSGDIAGLAASLIGSALAQVVGQELRYLVAERTARATEEQIVEVAESVDYERFETQEFHDLLDRANTNASANTYQMVYELVALFSVLASSLAVAVVLVRTVPGIVPALILLALPFVAAARASARRAFATTYELTANDRARSYLFRAMTSKVTAKEVRVFGLAPVLRARWDALYEDRLRRLRALARRRGAYSALAAVTSAALVSVLMVVLVRSTIERDLSVADAAIAIVALQQLATRIRSAANSSGSMRRASLFLGDFDRFLSLRGERRDADVAAPLALGQLRAERVSFRYPGTTVDVLHDVSLTLDPGRIVALVGVSGSGKTTLAHLLAGLYRPSEGRITYGGVDVSTIPRSRYWHGVGAVFQDYVRYEMSARENIAMGDPGGAGDHARVVDAAQRAGIATAIERLPASYDTMMSRSYEGGADLSVGQWQRLAVARALFRDAPLLILDEPAAALDAIAERDLYERLVELVAHRSVLLISHRFSTVRLADEILVMETGRIVERGTHAELIALGGRYAHMFSLQSIGYVDEPETGPDPLDGESTPAGAEVAPND